MPQEKSTNIAEKVKFHLLTDAKIYPFVDGKQQEESIAAPSVWKEHGALIFVVRRPGCRLCRSEGEKLTTIVNEARKERPNLGFAAILKENLPGEIDAFKPHFGDGSLYVDPELSFYSALGGKSASYLSIFKPTVITRYSTVPKHVQGNLKGEGLKLGGVLVVGPGEQGLVYAHLEHSIGVHANATEIRAAIEKLPKPTNSD